MKKNIYHKETGQIRSGHKLPQKKEVVFVGTGIIKIQNIKKEDA
jgi:hypothetical protein